VNRNLLLVVGAVAFAASIVVARVCESAARRAGLVTSPREDRWHRKPVALLGGVAIMVGTLVPLALVPASVSRFGVLLLPALAMGAVGLIDDLRPLRPQVKLVVQIILAAVLIQLGLLLRLTPYTLLNIFLTLFWIVGITNAFNLLDNMDGLAAGMALVAAGFRLVFFLADGDQTGAVVTAAFMGGVAGFLVRNLPPAKIFMGDAGSLFVGFFLGGLSLAGEYAYSRGLSAVLVFPVLLMLIPIFDTTFVTLTRLITGRPVSKGGRDHTSHRLVSLGISERQAVALLCGISVLSGLLAVVSYQYGFTYTIVLLALLLLGLFFLGVHLSRVTVVRDASSPVTAPIVRVVADFPFKRHVSTVANDLVLIVAAYYSAYLLRFEGAFEAHREIFLETVGPVIVIQISALTLSGNYRGLWRYTSLPELLRLVRGITVGCGGTVLYLVFVTRFENLSRAVFILDWLLLVALLGGARVSFRILAEVLRPATDDFRRVLIYGAGDGGDLALREIRKNPKLRREPIGFLDDDASKVGTRLHEVPVLGTLEDLEAVLASQRIDEVIVASEKIREDRLRALDNVCATHGVPVARASLRIE
jgi:UDP-GlcNAc:undecaprenyl-phosphate/decaprenyl-phosphate GlcNAc-1-phosphate transferase